ncbi:MAG: Divergent PAP2 family protein [uncultured bacterium]|nr:MAG: Divergent PAP2 family protein [uncultured bacterium]HBR71788.1 hypothetical protein [Candidatus Moranbacteria bacterium]
MFDLSFYGVIIIPIVVGGIAQITKFVLYSLKHGWNYRYIMTHGHMPSAHTAFVISLVAAVGNYEGIHSGAFSISVAFAIIVIDDAVRLRAYMGDQGRYLNMLVQQLDIEEKFPRLKERMGHRVSEVIIGAIYGLLLTFAFIKILG